MIDVAQPPGGRIAVVGSGSAAHRHAQVLRASCPHATIVGVRRSGRRFEDDAVDDVVGDVDDLRRDPPGVAIVASPATEHAGHALALAAFGCHVLVEKPLAVDLPSASTMVDTFERAGLVLAVGYQLRHSSPVRAFADLLAGPAGGLRHLAVEVGQWLPDWRPSRDYRETVTAQRLLGGGALLELSHEIDIVRSLLGGGQVVGARVARSGCLDIDVEDVADLIVEHGEVGATIHLDLLQRPARRRYRALTTTGIADLDLLAGTVRWHPRDSGAPSLVHEAAPGWLAAAAAHVTADFLACVEDDRPPLVGGRDGLETLALVDCARRISGGHS